MNQFDYHVIKTARDGIDEMDRQRMKLGWTQMKISEAAGVPDLGQTLSRGVRSGDMKFSKLLRFLHAEGYELVMVKKQEGE